MNSRTNAKMKAKLEILFGSESIEISFLAKLVEALWEGVKEHVDWGKLQSIQKRSSAPLGLLPKQRGNELNCP